MIDKETLMRISKTKGILNTGNAEKDYFQEIILLAVSREEPSLVFKGGTALYKFHGLDRFSEDLDFTGSIKENTFERIAAYLKDFGFEAKVDIKVIGSGQLATFAVRGFLYNGNDVSLARVRMDVNSVSDIRTETVWQTLFSLYPDIPSFRMKTLTLEEMLAEKVRSLIMRKKARDTYDIWFLLNKKVIPNMDLISEKLEYYDVEYSKESFKDAIEASRRTWSIELKAMVRELPDFNDVVKAIQGSSL